MKIKKINMKKAAVSCAAICLAGALCWNGSSITAWAAPTSGTAINDNTRVRSAIGGSPIGSLKANQEVTIKGEQTSGDGYTWYEITFDWNGAETDGWVRSDMISSETEQQQKMTHQIRQIPLIHQIKIQKHRTEHSRFLEKLMKSQINFRHLRFRQGLRQRLLPTQVKTFPQQKWNRAM